jgi:putative ABC transport system permease protein
MNLLTLSGAYLRYNLLNTLLNLLLLALGMGTIVTLLLVSQQLEDRLLRDSRGIDLVVGAKGSPLQLMLSSLYHADVPTGNIPLSEARKLMTHKMVKTAIPLALGDNYHGYRIVGTTKAYPLHYEATLAQGHFWENTLEATLGAEVARQTGLEIGTHFVGAHGLTHGTMVGEHIHGEYKYTVTGILKPTGTVIDRLILTDVKTVWEVHNEQHQEENGEPDHTHVHDDHEEEEHAHSDEHTDEHNDHEEQEHAHTNEHQEDGEPDHTHVHDDHEEEEHAHSDEHTDEHNDHEEQEHAHTNEHQKDEEQDHTHGHDEEEEHAHTNKHEKDEKQDHTNEHREHEEEYEDEEHAHSNEHEITALLIQYQSPIAAVGFPRMVNRLHSLQAASPAFETARLLKLVGFGIDTLRTFGILFIIMAILSMFIALYRALQERCYDLAIMRTLGASKLRLLWQLLFEGILMALLGTLLGLLLGHIVTEILGIWLTQTQQIYFTGWTYITQEYLLFGLALLIGTLSALLPAIQAYRTDIAKILSYG